MTPVAPVRRMHAILDLVNDMSNDTRPGHRDETTPAAARLLGHRADDPHLLREVMRLHQVMMSSFPRRTGMTASRFALVRLVANAGEAGTGVMALARQLGINAAAVTRQVNEMEAEGLVRRRPDAKDGRRSHVRLSRKGLETFAAIHGRAHDLERALGAIVPPEQMRAAARTLAALRQAIEQMAEGQG